MHEQLRSQFTATKSFTIVIVNVASTFAFNHDITNLHTQFLQMYVMSFGQLLVFEPLLIYSEASIAVFIQHWLQSQHQTSLTTEFKLNLIKT